MRQGSKTRQGMAKIYPTIGKLNKMTDLTEMCGSDERKHEGYFIYMEYNHWVDLFGNVQM